MMNDEPIILSDEGRLRHRQILEAALRASRSRKRRRVAIGATSAGAAVATIALLLLRQTNITAPPSPITLPVAITPATEPAAPLVIVQRIETDPNILRRLALPPIQSIVRHINEDELLKELADAHQPAGVISVDGKARLIFR
jgi:hypothetical protein